MKRNYWPLFFIGIFTFTLGMIVWTIMSAVKTPVNEDMSFLQKYQDVDENYNKLMTSNLVFKSKYKLEFIINSKVINLTTEDIKYSQRVLEKKTKHKNLLVLGTNELKIKVINKKTNLKENVLVNLNITKSISNDSDIFLNNSNFKESDKTYANTFNIKEENNWNITGSFTVGNEIGYIFIKTNAI